MKEQFINEVLEGVLPYLDNAQLIQLKHMLERALLQYEISEIASEQFENNSNVLLDRFIAAKRIEGCSEMRN